MIDKKNTILSKIFIFLYLLLPFMVSCTNRNNESNSVPLYQVVKYGKWGFINKIGEIIIPIQFDNINEDGFCEGLASVEYKKKWGVINEKGKWEVEPIYNYISSFSEGIVGVSYKRKWGFIDRTGKTIIDFKYKRVYWFHEGIAIVVNEFDEKNLISVIDAEGNTIIPFKYIEISSREWNERPGYRFQNGLLPIHTPDYKGGYINKKGEVIIEPQFNSGSMHQYGLAAVNIEIAGNEKGGYIDTKGNLIIKSIYDRVFDFYKDGDNILANVVMNEKWGCINDEGRLIIDFKYDLLANFNEGLAYAEEKGSELGGFINLKGEWEIKPQFYYARYSFSQGLANCQINYNGKYQYGYIDRTGKWVIEPQFDFAYPFDENGIAMVKMGKDEYTAAIGYINKKGEYIWKPSK